MLEPAPGVEFGRYVMVGHPTYYGAGSLVPARESRSGARRALWLVMPHVVASPEQRAAVVRVATVLRRLDSPHLLRLHEFGEVDGQPFFATAPLDGVDLLQACAPDGIPPEDALDLVAQIGAGLDALHHAGLVDGALGPHRILVEERDGRVHATVVHAAIMSVLLSTSALFGTQKQEALDFGAPELRGEEPSARSDVYSLGCLLWLTLTGQQPFPSYAAHASAPLPQLAASGPVEEAINSVLQRALAKDPASRYRDVASFAGTIRAISALIQDGSVGEAPGRVLPGDPAESGPEPEQLASPEIVAAPGTVRAARASHAAPYAAEEESPLLEPAYGPAIHVPAGQAGATAPRSGAHAAVVEAPVVEALPDEADRALQEAVKHWSARTSSTRVLHGPRDRHRLLRTSVVAAGVGVVALASVWGARHVDLLDRTAPAASETRSGTVLPTPTASASETLAPLERLFPIAATDVCRRDRTKVAHRIERWTCEDDGFRVVLSHWDSRASAHSLVPHGGDKAARGTWMLDGTRAGVAWTWRSAGARPFRWTAVYDDVPYAIVIEAKDKAHRHRARQHVVIHPSTVLG